MRVFSSEDQVCSSASTASENPNMKHLLSPTTQALLATGPLQDPAMRAARMRRVFAVNRLDITYHVHNSTLQTLHDAFLVATSTHPTAPANCPTGPPLQPTHRSSTDRPTPAPRSTSSTMSTRARFDGISSGATKRNATVCQIHHVLSAFVTHARIALCLFTTLGPTQAVKLSNLPLGTGTLD